MIRFAKTIKRAREIAKEMQLADSEHAIDVKIEQTMKGEDAWGIYKNPHFDFVIHNETE